MANIFTQNPMRIDSVMANDYLTTIGASAGLERPVRLRKIAFENPTAGGTITVTDGSASANVIFETPLPTAGATVPRVPDSDFETPLLWRNFKVTAFPAGAVMWLYR